MIVMKKLFMLAVIVGAMTLLSCSVESRAERYAVKVVSAESWSEKGEIMKDMKAYVEDLSDEDQVLFLEAFAKKTKDLGQDALNEWF